MYIIVVIESPYVTDHEAVVSALQHFTQVTYIGLSGIDLGNNSAVLITPHMTQLHRIELNAVKMSTSEMGGVCL